MGKKRRRRRSRRQSWWQGSTGGMKNWLAVALVAVIAVGALGFSIAALQRDDAAASADYTPGPIPTFGTPAPERTFALFVGDSYSAGAGASAAEQRWTTLASRELGWTENNAALGGTGYIATAGANGCGLDYCGTYSEAIGGVENAKPTLVVISGGRNDNTRLSQDPGAVERTIRAAMERWPEARIVVTSPLWDDDAAPAWMAQSIDIVRQAAAATGATFLDLGQPLAGHPDYVVESDGVHPNDAGYAAIAAAFVAAWNAANPT